MSSDPLSLPEIWSDLPKGDAYESARTELAASRRSGLVLIEYASGYAASDPQPVDRPPDRVERAAAGERLPRLAPAALAKGLADLTAIVSQAEALLRAQGALKGDVHFAVERIHDIAMALRMRDADTTLCDTLDASVREVGDAVVRHEAAATGALSAAALLRDVTRRMEDLARVASHMIASDAEAMVRPAGREADAVVEAAAAMSEAAIAVVAVAVEPAPGDEPRGSGEMAAGGSPAGSQGEPGRGPEAEIAGALLLRPAGLTIAGDDDARASRIAAFANEALGDEVVSKPEAVAEPEREAPAASSAPVVAYRPQSVDAVVEKADRDGDAAPTSATATAQTVSAALAAEVPAASSPSASEREAAVAAARRRPANDPLAVLHGLSEEELIALFS